jgi:hypothetical protein
MTPKWNSLHRVEVAYWMLTGLFLGHHLDLVVKEQKAKNYMGMLGIYN